MNDFTLPPLIVLPCTSPCSVFHRQVIGKHRLGASQSEPRHRQGKHRLQYHPHKAIPPRNTPSGRICAKGRWDIPVSVPPLLPITPQLLKNAAAASLSTGTRTAAAAYPARR